MKCTKEHRNQIISQLRAIARNGTITQRMAEDARLYPTTVEDAFGKWAKAIKVAGLRMGRPGSISRADALADLIRVRASLGHNPSAVEYKKEGRCTNTSIEKLFGTWHKARNAVDNALTSR
jgi:hypothetical protein